MAAKRHSVWRTPSGGVSLGYSGWKTFEECKEQFWNGYLEGGTGVEQVGDGWQFERCYGSAWHELWRACAVEGLRAADKLESYYGGWCEVEGYDFREPHVLALYRTLLEDLTWYFDQPQEWKTLTLLAEQELVAEVKSPRTGLVHQLRGTPDAVGEMDASYGGGKYIIDAKTYGVIKRDGKLYVDPMDSKLKKDGRYNSQFPAYMGLYALTHGEAIYDGKAMFVPQRAAEAQRMLLGRRGQQKTLRVHHEPVIVSPDLVRETMDSWVQACDDIAQFLDAADPHDEFLRRRNRQACVKEWGFLCQYESLCHNPDSRNDLVAYNWQPRVLVEPQTKEAA